MRHNGHEPASPVTIPDEYADAGCYPGLTKRERIATAAMQGILSSGSLTAGAQGQVGRRAVAFADQLLDELER